ncbi:hypothetical protein QJS66_16800 [Kocuria rhizophila]|nr:hypothetical protein QJS66_16800 [Kocuria rhizophila]
MGLGRQARSSRTASRQHVRASRHRAHLPEAAAGGAIGLVSAGDGRSTWRTGSCGSTWTTRARAPSPGEENPPWKPTKPRERRVSKALKAYASMVTSADEGAVRVVED